ncbi:MAG: right-handed parallel beta-helix repeat-containing protein [Bacteroidota bacterium]
MTLSKPLCILLLCIFGWHSTKAQQQEIFVDHIETFLNAIGPNRHIRLAPGVYELMDGRDIRSPYFTWGSEDSDNDLIIHDVEGLTITGAGKAQILMEDTYSWVCKFRRTNRLRLENLTFGHLTENECYGGVLSFHDLEDVQVSHCILFGSGLEGLELDSVKGFTFRESTIKECTYDLMYLNESEDLIFEDAFFLDTRYGDPITLEDVHDVRFTRCTFQGNETGYGNYHFWYIGDNVAHILLQDCAFLNNRVDYFSSDETLIKLENVTFRDNKFEEP